MRSPGVDPATAPWPAESESLGRRLLAGGSWSLFGRVATMLTGLVTGVLLTRLIPPADVGTYLLALSVASVGALLGGLGLHQVVVRVVAESLGAGSPALAWRAAGTCARLAVTGLLAVSLGYLVLGQQLGAHIFGSPSLAALTVPVAAWMIALGAQGLVTETYRGLGDIRAAALLGAPASAVILIPLLLLALLAGIPVTLALAAAAAVASVALGTLIGAAVLRRRWSRTPMATTAPYAISASTLLGTAAPLLATNVLLVVLTYADLWVVAALLPETEVAVYGTAARVAGIVGMPLLVANGVLAPLIADLHARGRHAQLEQAMRATASVASVPAMLLAAVFVVAGAPLLDLVYGEPYGAGGLTLALLALGQVTNVVAGSCGLALAMTGRQRELALTTLATGGLLLPVALVVLTRAHGTTGAALASAGGLAIQNILWVLTARRTTGVWTGASRAYLHSCAGPIRRALSARWIR